MLIKDVQNVYYIKNGRYFNVPHLAGDVHNYEFPKRVIGNHDIKIYKQCLDGNVIEILMNATFRKKINSAILNN